ncbi:MAG: acyltransferase [Verrucomicrobia bacterium]|nr:acyltransferase [Verrucomicrobiota bacterium]
MFQNDSLEIYQQLLHWSPGERAANTAQSPGSSIGSQGMSVTSIWPTVLLMGGYLLVGTVIARHVGFYRDITKPAPSVRFGTLDGLRGFLAMGVFFHHCAVSRVYFETGSWRLPSSVFYSLLGPISVSLFFMITGFLFWDKAIRNQAQLRPVVLYKGRFLRIAPLYFFSAILILLVVGYRSGFRIQKSDDIFPSILRALSVGLFNFGSLNGIPVHSINAGVLWTLSYEWQFYLALPFMSWFATGKRFVPFAGVLLVLCWRWPDYFRVTFLAGMLVSYLCRVDSLRNLLTKKWITPICLAALFMCFSHPVSAHPRLRTALVGFLFLAIVCGNDMFGLLTWPCSKYLGTISYSVYLLHGFVLLFVLHAANALWPLKSSNPYGYWAICGCAGLLVVLSCGITYRWIEHPFLKAKQKSRTAAKPAAQSLEEFARVSE